MTSLNNIEKLIQMATIEHMYEMLQKIKNDINLNHLSENIFDTSNCSNNFLPPENYKNEVNELNETISIIKSDNTNIMKIIDTLSSRINYLELELQELKSKNDTLSSEIKRLNEPSQCGHITLKIEEKNIDTCELLEKNNDEMLEKIKQLEEVELEEEVEQEVELEEEEQEELEEEEQEELEEEEQEQQQEEEEEEELEEEVGTDEEKEEKKDSLEEEDDEEVFEIEIDDITYFTTDEENGILYEVTSDGEVGNKVGIIKNGEPIFS
jgi:hypothetical protein